MRRSVMLATLSAVTLLVEVLPSVTAVGATVPSENGKIAFTTTRDGNFEIYAMDHDGSNQTRLTNHPADDREAAWSPDGTRIAFTSDRDGNGEIYLMDADGSNVTNLTNHPGGDGDAAWSPDGTKIAFRTTRDGNWEIYVMDADGSNQVNLTGHPEGDLQPTWSPDGTKIAFTTTRDNDWEIYVMDADGSSQINLTNHLGGDYLPAWSPDGTKIAFSTIRDVDDEIYVMDADGSNQTNITTDPAYDFDPTWSPDGTKMGFTTSRDGNPEIYVMDADGSSPTRLTDHPGTDWEPDWQSLPTDPQVDLELAKRDTADPVAVGDSFSYVLRAANQGADQATDVVLTDVLPPEVTFMAATPTKGSCSEAGGTVTCQVPLLPRDAAFRVRVDVTANSAGVVTNTAQVQAAEDDPVPANNTAMEETTIDGSQGHTLTVGVTGQGRVLSSPAGIRCEPDCIEDYAPGSTVHLSARPGSGWSFAGWGGACSGTATPCTVVMDGDKAVTATFQHD